MTMPAYNGRAYGPDEPMSNCRNCLWPEAWHEPAEAYYGEERLEGRKSSSPAKRMNNCRGYENAGLTLGELSSLRYCSGQWRSAKRGE